MLRKRQYIQRKGAIHNVLYNEMLQIRVCYATVFSNHDIPQSIIPEGFKIKTLSEVFSTLREH